MTKLKEGDPAPAINAVDQDGKEITLDAYKGKKIVLYFYPKDDTPGCTAESCDLRDNYEEFLKKGFDIIMPCNYPFIRFIFINIYVVAS